MSKCLVPAADALPREPIRMVRGQPEQTVAWPKHGDASCSHGTFLPAALRALQSPEIYYRSRDHGHGSRVEEAFAHPRWKCDVHDHHQEQLPYIIDIEAIISIDALLI